MPDDACVRKCVCVYLFRIQSIFVERGDITTRQNDVTKC